MANTDILQLPVAINVSANDWVPLVQGTGPSAVTRRATAQNVAVAGQIALAAPGGSDGQVQYNNNQTFGGVPILSYKSTSQMMEWAPTATGGGWMQFPQGATAIDYPSIRWSSTDAQWTNGPVARPTYNDRVQMEAGFNVSSPGTLIDVTSHGFWSSREYLFYQSSTFASEYHACSIKPMGSGAIVRLTTSGGAIVSASTVTGGKSYTVGMDVPVEGGTNGVLTVATVNGSGSPLTWTVKTAGSGYTNSATAQMGPYAMLAVTAGVITGATATVPGYGFTVGETLTVPGGTNGVLVVAAVDANGGITSYTVNSDNGGGSGYTNGTNTLLKAGEIRPLTFFLPYNGGLGSSCGIAVDNRTETTYAGRVKIQWAYRTGVADFNDGFSLRFQKNNVVPIQQLKADGVTLQGLFYLNSVDQLAFGVPINVACPVPTSTSYPLANIQGTTALGDGQNLLNVTGVPLTGLDIKSVIIRQNTNFEHSILVDNQNATGCTAIWAQSTSGSTLGAGFVAARGASTWFMGTNGSGTWELARNSYSGTNVTLGADSNKITASLPFKVPSYLKASVPSASTVGAGSVIYVTDAAAGANLYISDATNWRDPARTILS